MKSAKKSSQTQSKLSHFFKVANNAGADKEEGQERRTLFSHAGKHQSQDAPAKQRCEEEKEIGDPSGGDGRDVALPASGRKREHEQAERGSGGRSLRRRVRRSLKESSEEEEEEEEEERIVSHVVASDSDSDEGKKSSSHTTPAKCEMNVDVFDCTPAMKKKEEEEEEEEKKKERKGAKGKGEKGERRGFTPFKRKLESVVEEDKVEVKTAASLTDKEAKKRHEQFVKKVSLFKERLDREEKKEVTDSQSSFQSVDLVPTDLTYPKGAKLTPFEEQVVEIKKKHPDVVLLVECGYKFRFLGRDAEIASKVLHIFHHIDHNFLTASIPTFRLQVHIRRLVEAGYKVGVVRQMETAAIKAADAKRRNSNFRRELCELFTKSTMMVEDVEIVGHSFSPSSSSSSSVYLMCVYEQEGGGEEEADVGIVCIDTSSGDIVYDSFKDDRTRSELESRLCHLQPKEMVLPENLSVNSMKLIKRHVGGRQKSSTRVEIISPNLFKQAAAHRAISSFFDKNDGDEGRSDDDGSEIGAAEVGCVFEGRIGGAGLKSVMQLPAAVISCLGGLLHYLKEFKLESVLQLTTNFWKFSSPSHMQLSSSVLSNLELLSTQEGSEHGSLLWLLKQTRTAFGARLLRQWITHPLLDKERIVARHEAVEELMLDPAPLDELQQQLRGLPDLERALARLHYHKSAPNELLLLLKTFLQLSTLLKDAKAQSSQLSSSLLKSLVASSVDSTSMLSSFMDEIEEAAATACSASGKPDPDYRNILKGFNDSEQYPEIFRVKQEISLVEERLEEHLLDCRKILSMPSLEYKTVLVSTYLLEVPNEKQGRVPKDWLKINSTKAAGRYHSPQVRSLLQELQFHQEKLDALVSSAWSKFQQRVASCYGGLKLIVQRLAVLDCLLSFASAAKRGGWTRPQMLENHRLCILGGRHPMVEALMGSGYVPNDLRLGEKEEEKRGMIITGPNMGGKSSYMRQNALIVLMAQIGSFVPADSAELGVFDNIFTRMGAEDFIAQGRSTFLVELQEASAILSRATSRSLVIMDELGRGTSTHDGTAIAYATLRALVEETRCFTLFVTHYQLICQLEDELAGQVANYHMSFLEEGKERIAFMYRLKKGRADRSFGLNVALLARIPEHLVDRACAMSKSLEEQVKQQLVSSAKVLTGRIFEAVGEEGRGTGEDGKENEEDRLRKLASMARLCVSTYQLQPEG